MSWKPMADNAGASKAAEPRRPRPRMLCVDDEPFVLEGLQDTLRHSFEVQVATSGADGLTILYRDPDAFAVVISDMRMPKMSGAEFLRGAATVAPDAVRILLTGQADLQDAIQAVNEAQLFRFLTKPCDPRELHEACSEALAQHQLKTAERRLLEETVRGSVEALSEALALSNPHVFGRAGEVKNLAARLARESGFRSWWEVEVAAALGQLGAVALPAHTAEKLYAGKSLSTAEEGMVARVPTITRSLLVKIPRLEGVIEILDVCSGRLAAGDGRLSEQAVQGAGILSVATEYCDLESQGTTSGIALGVMRSRGKHPSQLLDLLAQLVGAQQETAGEVAVSELAVGMVLSDDVKSIHGALLVTRGQPVTEHLRERLRNLGQATVQEPLRVRFATPAVVAAAA